MPEPGEDEVLIRVTRAGVNFADTHMRENAYVQKAALPLVPGSEVAGVREDTGERVVALCGRGGYAEYAVAPAGRVHPIPEGVGDDVALALLVQGLTAWHLYRTQGRVAPGESVVVISGAGGVGSLAVQLGHRLGAGRVIATASSEEKRALCLRLGRRRRRRRGRRRLGRPPPRGQRRPARRRRLRDGRRRRVRPVPPGARPARPARRLRDLLAGGQRGPHRARCSSARTA